MTAYGQRTMTDLEIYNALPVVPPSSGRFFLDDSLYSIWRKDRPNGMVYVRNLHDKEIYTVFIEDMAKRRKPAYTVTQAADLLNRHISTFRRMVWLGTLKEATYSTPDKKWGKGQRGWYSDEDIFEMRDIIAEGQRKRSDGTFIQASFLPTAQELTRRMGRGMLMYTKTHDGRFIPVWDATN